MSFTENTMPIGLFVDELVRQVLADPDSEEEYSPSGRLLAVPKYQHWQTF